MSNKRPRYGSIGEYGIKAPFEDRRVALGASDRLIFAKQVLAWLAVISIAIIAGHAALPDNKGLNDAFELVKIGFLPVLTLVLSFYFPSNRGGG